MSVVAACALNSDLNALISSILTKELLNRLKNLSSD